MNIQRRFAPISSHFEPKRVVGFRRICIYLLVLFLPFQRLEVVIGPIGVSLVDLITWSWLLAYGIRILEGRTHKTKLNLFVAFWLLATLISGVVAMNKVVFLVALGSRTSYAMILIASYYELYKRPQMLRSITNLYIGVALFVALFGGLQLVGLIPSPLVDPFFGQLIGSGGRLRMSSFLSNSNLLAGYLSVAVFFSWAMYRQSFGSRQLKYLASFVLLMIAVLFTFSRAGYLGIGAGVMVLFMVGNRRKLRGRFFKIVSGTLLVAFLLVLLFTAYNILFRRTSGSLSALGGIVELDSSNRKRLIFWETAINMYKSSPIVGVGAGQFNIQFENYVPLQHHFFAVNNVHTTVHNTYLQILTESGLLGLAAFLALFGYIVLTALRAKGSAPNLRQGVKGSLAGLVSLLMIGLTHNMVMTEIWLIAGLVLAYTQQYQASKEAPKYQILRRRSIS